MCALVSALRARNREPHGNPLYGHRRAKTAYLGIAFDGIFHAENCIDDWMSRDDSSQMDSSKAGKSS